MRQNRSDSHKMTVRKTTSITNEISSKALFSQKEMSTNHKPTQIQYRNPAKEKTTDIQNVCKYRLGLGIDIHFTI